ncbi:hypothetical protein GCM10010502_62270 [Kitasatospora aureofaciens]|uniref:Uncharacterized protein n=1 Tax=Kitasatospora aureofaciens TaxID=1894 RepID=A0A8H9LV51_KITAU|nr:hypothetical protein GCM10010502_62270 [Kitasatospora aureofaciens]
MLLVCTEKVRAALRCSLRPPGRPELPAPWRADSASALLRGSRMGLVELPGTRTVGGDYLRLGTPNKPCKGAISGALESR